MTWQEYKCIALIRMLRMLEHYEAELVLVEGWLSKRGYNRLDQVMIDLGWTLYQTRNMRV